MNRNKTLAFLWLSILISVACNVFSGSVPVDRNAVQATQIEQAVQMQLTKAAISRSQALEPASIPTNTPPFFSALEQQATEVAAPCNSIQFVGDVTIPDGASVAPDTYFTKTWRFKNVGSCTWSSTGYSLVFDHGDPMDAPRVAPLTSISIPPGSTVDLSIDLKSPAASGTYEADFQLFSPDGVVVGSGPNGEDYIWARIVVPERSADSNLSSSDPLYAQLLGKTLSDNAVSDFILRNNCYQGGFHYLCKSVGVELSLDSGQKVITVFMYSQDVDGFNQFAGDLPYNLDWNSTRSDVQAILGSPSAQGVDETTSWDGYQDAGVYIDYASPSTEDLSARMIMIQIQQR